MIPTVSVLIEYSIGYRFLFLNANIFSNLSNFSPSDFLTNDVTLTSASKRRGVDISFLKDAGNTLQMAALEMPVTSMHHPSVARLVS